MTSDALTGEPGTAPARYATFTSRFRALLVDTAFVFGAIMVFVVLAEFADGVPGAGRIVWALMVGLLVLYEPILVWRRGATIGHSTRRLRVVRTATGEPPGFFRAFARYLIKVFLGLPTFVTMALTRKHQAVHDILTKTTVQLTALADPDVDDYHLERVDGLDVELPSRGRRVAVIVASIIALFLGYSIVVGILDPEQCVRAHSCTGSLEILINGLSLLWLGLTVGIVIAGWRGLLPGARRVKQGSPHLSAPAEPE